MANGFSITINAVNNASGVIEKINKSLTAMQAPGKNLSTQIKKFGELTGLTKVSQGFDSIVRSSLGAARSVTRVAEPLAVITGAASIGGFTMLLSKWAEMNTTLGFSAQRMGVMPQMLGNLRAAGSLAGGSADAMQSGFDNLGQTLYDVANGQAPQAAYVMSRLGISLTDAAGHARKAKDVMPQLQAAIRNIKDPLAQARLATMMFGAAGIDMLPVLRLSQAELDRLHQQVVRYGGTTDAGTAAALQFSQAQAAVGQSVIGLTDAIATQLAPVISPLLTDLADWIAKGRTSQFVTHDLGEDVKGFAVWLKALDFGGAIEGVENFGDKVVGVLAYLDSWRDKIEYIRGLQPDPDKIPVGKVGNTNDYHEEPIPWYLRALGIQVYKPRYLYGAGSNAVLPTPTTAEQKVRAAHAMDVLQKLGWPRAIAAGMAVNVQRESGFNPGAVGDHGLAFGADQWHPDRQQDFADWAGFDIRDPRATLDKQLGFMSFELLHGKEQAAGRDLQMARNNPSFAAAIVSSEDLRPGDRLGEMDARGAMARQLFDTTPAGASADLSPAAGASGASGATGRVEVTITAPPNHKVTARATGNVNTPKIATATADSGTALGPTGW